MSEPKKQLEQYFLELYQEYSDAIFRFCFFRCHGQREKALDITQETFVKTWDYLRSGKSIIQPKPFLYKVAKNLIINDGLKKKESSLDFLQNEGFDLGHDEKETWHLIIEGKRILGRLREIDEDYQEVIILRYIQDLSVKDIAAITGESENVISVRLHRGLKKLRELM